MLAAGANSTSSVLQRKANQSEPDSLSLSPRLILDLFHRPVWFTGLLAVIVGFLLQAAALAHGELAVVEPLLVLELPFTLVLATVVFRKGLHRREWTAAGAMTAGLILLIASLSPHGGSARQVPATTWALATAASVAAICFLVAAARTSRGSRRAALLGVATGTTFGLTASLMTAMSEQLAAGLGAVLTTWQTYAMVVTGISAMFLLQSALQAGTLVAVQPGLTLTDPVVSILWGTVVFHEQVHAGPWVVAAVAGAGLILAGTISLSRSSLLSDKAGASAGGDGRRRQAQARAPAREAEQP